MHINYLIMSHNPINANRAIISAYNQVYPNEDKTIYLLYQEPLPKWIKCGLDIKIVQIDVAGIINQDWWMRKLLAYCNNIVIEDSITLMFDEDDIYEPYYTVKATPLLIWDEGHGLAKEEYDAAWNYNMIMVNKDGIKIDKWSSAISTLAIKTSVLKEVTYKLAELIPSLDWYDGKAPLDTKFRHFLEENHKVGLHDAVKAYFFTEDMNTSRLNQTVRELSIDYNEQV